MKIKVSVTKFNKREIVELRQAIEDVASAVKVLGGPDDNAAMVCSNWFEPESTTFEDLAQIESNFGCEVRVRIVNELKS